MKQRIIKFRAWFKDKKRLSSSFSLGLMTDKLRDYILNDMVTLLQFTGLKDRNGKEIYEGDLTKEGEVKWDYGGWYIRDEPIVEYAGTKGGSVEVIGNIYENPELLEGGE
jgi:uncharacterized phage protein (TIGR01671 family)